MWATPPTDPRPDYGSQTGRGLTVRLLRAGPSPGLACGRQLWSCGAVPIAALAFPLDQAGEGVEGGTRIGMRIEPAAAFGTDATPLADQQGAAEQVGPDLHAIEALF